MNLYEAALQIATEAHEGQFRDGGQPYITHPVAVARLVEEEFELSPCWLGCGIASSLALLHDVVEDSSMSSLDVSARLRELTKGKYILPRAISCIEQALRGLTHYKHIQSYANYILEVKRHSNWFARKVKLADLKHNLSDHKPGARRDKYELAVALLNA